MILLARSYKKKFVSLLDLCCIDSMVTIKGVSSFLLGLGWFARFMLFGPLLGYSVYSLYTLFSNKIFFPFAHKETNIYKKKKRMKSNTFKTYLVLGKKFVQANHENQGLYGCCFSLTHCK